MSSPSYRWKRGASVATLAASVSVGFALLAAGPTRGGAPGDSENLSPMAAVGEQLFSDVALSASGQQACSTCHVPTNAYTATDGLSVPLGGPNMDLPGLRNAPSLAYASYIPAMHFEADGTPVGGLFRDGRSPSLANQATQPFVTPFEMANADSNEVEQRLLTRPYLAQFVAVFGAATLNDPDLTLQRMGQAIAAYESEDLSFHPFSSKFDAWKSGQAKLTPQELHGFGLFLAPNKGNCAACHPATSSNVLPPMFTDFTYDNIGIPRNWRIPANDDSSTLPYVPQNGAALGAPMHNYYDMGLCGPLATDMTGINTLCGLFKVPTLRNIALTAPYFHNGQFFSLQDAVTWYITRDTQPQQWYLMPDGVTPDIAYNDLPVIDDGNVNAFEVPYNPGIAPTLTSAEINDLIAFLCTLTDGYDPGNPGAYRYPAQCAIAAGIPVPALSTHAAPE
jgi:cytochrome c peroxidase